MRSACARRHQRALSSSQALGSWRQAQTVQSAREEINLTLSTGQTLNERAGFLSNLEVLLLLRTQRASTDQKLKLLNERKQANRSGTMGDSLDFTEKDRIKPQDLQTVTFEAIKYLEEPVHPTTRQTEQSVTRLLDQLEQEPKYHQLTKAERLSLVNSAPTTLVELHVCIEDVAERFPEESEQLELIQLVRDHLDNSPHPETTTATRDYRQEEILEPDTMVEDEPQDEYYQDDGFVDESGRRGAGEGEERDLDEDKEEI
ncbi:DNA-directed RNA polymerase III subunit RPC17 [Sporobolomyces koalae]|uniref:DNA-directed RNA polymerase III subunit RPC17 n=1 Tax=Sporobolomyces koalae TaxID=500713 RepID=UPI00317D86F3